MNARSDDVASNGESYRATVSPSCPCGSTALRLRVPIHAMVEVNEHELTLEIDCASASHPLERDEWQGFCQECGLTVAASRVPADEHGRALYLVVRDVVKDVSDRIAGGVEAYVDLGHRPA